MASPWGSIAGGALKLGGSIFGGISASKAIKNIQKNLKQQMRENQDWYDRRYNEDTTQRADVQRILQATRDSIRDRNKMAAGTQAVTGGTDEALAASREANNAALADATSRIVIAGEARKDDIENQYLSTKSKLNNKLNEMDLQKAGAIANAVNGVADSAASMGKFF